VWDERLVDHAEALPDRLRVEQLAHHVDVVAQLQPAQAGRQAARPRAVAGVHDRIVGQEPRKCLVCAGQMHRVPQAEHVPTAHPDDLVLAEPCFQP
jgi:hypothetical protein